MSALARTVALCLLTLGALPVLAANRCVMPNGRIVYTDAPCESIGGRLERAVSREISVVPPQPGAEVRPSKAAPAREAPRPGPAFR